MRKTPGFGLWPPYTHVHTYMCMHTQDETGTGWSVFLVRNKRCTRLKSQTAESSGEFLLIEVRAKVNRMTEVSGLGQGTQSNYGLTQSDVVVAKKKKFSIWESGVSEV